MKYIGIHLVSSRRFMACLSALLGLVFLVGPARAEEYRWKGIGGYWTTPGNWQTYDLGNEEWVTATSYPNDIGTAQAYINYGYPSSPTINGTNPSANLICIGQASGDEGDLRLQNNGWLTTDQLIVGLEGMGSFTQNGTLSAGRVDIADQSGSTGTFTLQSGTANISNDFNVGTGGTGDLYISGGTLDVTGGDMQVGYSSGSVGTVNHSGGMARYMQLQVGTTDSTSSSYTLSGSADMEVADGLIINGGTFSQQSSASIDVEHLGAMSGGTYQISDGTMNVSGAYLYAVDGGLIVQTGGTVVCDGSYGDGDRYIYLSGSSYDLSGTGELQAGKIMSFNSTFYHADATAAVQTGEVMLHGGTYRLDGGTLNVGRAMVVGVTLDDGTTQTAQLNFDGTSGTIQAGSASQAACVNLTRTTLLSAGNGTLDIDNVDSLLILSSAQQSALGTINNEGRTHLIGNDLTFTSGESRFLSGDITDKVVMSGGTVEGTGHIVTLTGGVQMSGGTLNLSGITVPATESKLRISDPNSSVSGSAELMVSDLDVEAGGTLSLSGGSVTVQNFSMDSAGQLSFLLDEAFDGSSFITANNSPTLDGTLSVDFTGMAFAGEESWTLISSDNYFSGDFTSFEVLGLDPAMVSFDQVYTGDGYEYNVTAVPEPTTLGLLGLGGLALLQRRRSRQA